jgi:hypothetical protein
MADTLESLQDAIASLQKSSLRSLPVFMIGIIATLVAAAIAIYFIVTLSADLKDTRQALKQSQETLTAARTSLAKANSALVQTQQSGEAAGSSDQIAAAIAQVSNSQQDLRQVSTSLTEATLKLPAAGAEKDASLTGNWTDEYGTVYAVRHSGTDFGYRAAFRNAGALGGGGQGEASGTAKGRDLNYVYQDKGGNRFQCSGVVAPDSRSIEESCRTPDGKVLKVKLVRS